jgi:hypothetical protein
LAFLIPHINAIQLGTSLSLDGAVLCPWIKRLLISLAHFHPLRTSIAANECKRKCPYKFPKAPREGVPYPAKLHVLNAASVPYTPNTHTFPLKGTIGASFFFFFFSFFLVPFSFLKACHIFKSFFLLELILFYFTMSHILTLFYFLSWKMSNIYTKRVV